MSPLAAAFAQMDYSPCLSRLFGDTWHCSIRACKFISEYLPPCQRHAPSGRDARGELPCHSLGRPLVEQAEIGSVSEIRPSALPAALAVKGPHVPHPFPRCDDGLALA